MLFNQIAQIFASALVVSPPVYTYDYSNEAVAYDKNPLPGQSYSYAPAIYREGNKYLMYVCDSKIGYFGDNIGLLESGDGKIWSFVGTVFWSPTQLHNNFSIAHACDPSVVKFKAPADSQDYYYMFYSTSFRNTFHTVNSVARSTSATGPFQRLTNTNPVQWVAASDITSPPVALQTPDFTCPLCYGAGMPSVIVKDGMLWMWYSETTPSWKTFLTKSADGINWSTKQQTFFSSSDPIFSIDVKYDPSTNLFYMYDLIEDHQSPIALKHYYSSDGINWSNALPIQNGQSTGDASPSTVPEHVHNVGVSGTFHGHLAAGDQLVGFGTPDERINDQSWAEWDVYLAPIIPQRHSGSCNAPASPGFLLHSTSMAPSSNILIDYAFDDFDGNGSADLWLFQRQGVGMTKTAVHVFNGSNNFNSPLLHATTALHATDLDWSFKVGDWNADGKPDIFSFKRTGSSGKIEVHILDGNTNYTSFLGHYASGMPSFSGQANIDVGDHNADGVLDLYIIKHDAGLGRPHVSIYNGATLFSSLLYSGELPTSRSSYATFAVADWGTDGVVDIAEFRHRETATCSTELKLFNGPLYTSISSVQNTSLQMIFDLNQFQLISGRYFNRERLVAIRRFGGAGNISEIHIPYNH